MDLSALDRHAKIALSFSGGKDSLAVVYMLRDRLSQMTVYHVDTGDLLPETMEVVSHVRKMSPNFVYIPTDVGSWIGAHGLPTDLVPHSAHPIGRVMGEPHTPLVPRYDCCYFNLMLPLFQRVVADGNTLLIRGTKAVDMKTLPVATGDVQHGVEILYPLEDWSNTQVFDYLRSVGAPISRVYDYVTNSPECARCSAWWGEERNDYLRRFHPATWLGYRARIEAVADEINPPLAKLRHELIMRSQPPALSQEYTETASQEVWNRGIRILQGNRLGETDDEHVAVLLDHMRPAQGARLLDLGCGFGEVARIMRVAREDLQFSLLTNSLFQLERVPEMAGLNPVLGDMHHLPFEPGEFDGAMMLYSLCHTDPIDTLRPG